MNLLYHQLANSMPAMSEAEYSSLVKDIKMNGLKVPIVTYEGRLLDGRNRLRACLELGIKPSVSQFAGTEEEAETLMLSLNVHRRHLTVEQRRKIAEAELKADATRSDRTIAAKAGVSHTSIPKMRAALEAGGQIDQVAKTTGIDGKTYTRKDGSMRRLGLRQGMKSFEERVAEIAPLAASGMAPSQIAAHIGTSIKNVEDIIKRGNIPVPARAAMGKADRLKPDRVIEECVNTLGAVSRGLDRVKNADLNFAPDAARELFDEVRSSKRNIDWLAKKLKEIAHA